MDTKKTRRQFLGTASLGAVAVGLHDARLLAANEEKPPQAALPRWRGFNLVDFFQAFSRGERSAGVIREDDLRWIRDWGFDYIRLPMDYCRVMRRATEKIRESNTKTGTATSSIDSF